MVIGLNLTEGDIMMVSSVCCVIQYCIIQLFYRYTYSALKPNERSVILGNLWNIPVPYVLTSGLSKKTRISTNQLNLYFILYCRLYVFLVLVIGLNYKGVI